jgi:hypothetical protein
MSSTHSSVTKMRWQPVSRPFVSIPILPMPITTKATPSTHSSVTKMRWQPLSRPFVSIPILPRPITAKAMPCTHSNATKKHWQPMGRPFVPILSMPLHITAKAISLHGLASKEEPGRPMKKRDNSATRANCRKDQVACPFLLPFTPLI